jgi:putative membrane protein
MTGPVGWSLDPGAIGSVAVVATAYGVRARNLGRSGHAVPAWRQGCFYAGLAILLAALITPIDEIGERRVFYVHMVQHLMLGDLGPLALVLGLTGPILRPVLVLPGIRHLRVLAHPLAALPAWAATFYVWHLPAVYEAALAHPALHALEHLSFLCAGLMIWAAVIEPLPGPAWFGNGAKAAFVLAVRALSGVLATVFIWAGRPLYPDYAAGERVWGISPLSDQTIGGAIMFVEGATVTLFVFAWLFLRWTRESELRQSLVERGESPARAERSARYGGVAAAASSSARWRS